jgi:cytochrome c oxidase assembly factor CtaG
MWMFNMAIVMVVVVGGLLYCLRMVVIKKELDD